MPAAVHHAVPASSSSVSIDRQQVLRRRGAHAPRAMTVSDAAMEIPDAQYAYVHTLVPCVVARQTLTVELKTSASGVRVEWLP